MQKEEFCYASADGQHQIYAARWIPDGEIRGILQIVHGMSEYIDRYDAFAHFMNTMGILVTGDDHLGHGKTITEHGSLQGYICEQDPASVLIEDEHSLQKLTQEMYPRLPYFMLGHSMGSFMARNYMQQYGSALRGIIIMGTGNQPKSVLNFSKVLAGFIGFFYGQKHPSKFMEKLSFGGYLKKISNPKTPFDWLSVNEENVSRYMNDPLCGFTFTVNGYKAIAELLYRLTDTDSLKKIPAELPILLVSGAQDPVGNYGEAVRQTAQALTETGHTAVTVQLYPNDRHEILNELDREQVYQDLYQWINIHL